MCFIAIVQASWQNNIFKNYYQVVWNSIPVFLTCTRWLTNETPKETCELSNYGLCRAYAVFSHVERTWRPPPFWKHVVAALNEAPEEDPVHGSRTPPRRRGCGTPARGTARCRGERWALETASTGYCAASGDEPRGCQAWLVAGADLRHSAASSSARTWSPRTRGSRALEGLAPVATASGSAGLRWSPACTWPPRKSDPTE